MHPVVGAVAIAAALLVGFAAGVVWCRRAGHRWLASKPARYSTREASKRRHPTAG